MRAGSYWTPNGTMQAFPQVSLPSTKLTCKAPTLHPTLLGKVTVATRGRTGGTALGASQKFGLAAAEA